jgi:hypothetical protein
MFQRIQLLHTNSTPFANKLTIELSHLIGFKTIAMEFPLVVFELPSRAEILCFIIEEDLHEGFKVETVGNKVIIHIASSGDSIKQAYEYVREHFHSLTQDFQRSTHEQKADDGFLAAKTLPIDAFDRRERKGLESLFDKDYILHDDNHDLLPDRLDARILLSKNFSKEQIAAACNIAARLGLETTAAAYPITCTYETANNVFIFETAETCRLAVEEVGDKRRFVCSGDGDELVNFSSVLCETFPLQKPGLRWVDLLTELSDGLCMKTVDGQLAYLELEKDKISSSTNCYFSPKIKEVSEEVLKDYAPANFYGYKDIKPVFEKEYDIPWEVDVCKAILEEKLWSHINKDDKVEIRAILSEDKDIRGKLAAELIDIANKKEIELASIQIICAYKQGFSWLEEIVMPKIRGKVDKIDISFKPFLAPGITDWRDEDGAIPTYDNFSTDDADKWYDLPIRYLQELYPIDDILAAGLGIDRNSITFSEYSGNEDITYLVTATEKGKVVCEETYKATASERNYMDAFPDMGKVHPSTGWIFVTVNDKEFISERIPTDVEHVWQIYQEEILPYCKEYCDKKTNGKPTVAHQPFFAQMRFDIELSEPNENLDCREDILSSLDTLHEDMYFSGLDFFKVYGHTASGSIFDAPGLILPVIKKRPGKPSFKFTLYDQHANEAKIDFSDSTVKSRFKKGELHVTIPELMWSNGKLCPVIRVEGGKGITPLLDSFAKLLSEHKLFFEQKLANIDSMYFDALEEGKTTRFKIDVCETPEPQKDLSIEDIDIMESTLIGYDQYIEIIGQLKRVPGISVYHSAETYQGRDVYAVEFLSEYKGYVSQVKRVNQNPSLFINARHHANEVSATNASFMLIKELLTNDEFKQLTHQLNLVMVPFANADGGAIHYELQKDNPTWILHIARFNSVGREFYHEYFKDDTIHTEALCATRVWRKWLPDIIVDNHGIPTHEWSQQFSGYTSPSYKGFWLPRSLLYGCFWTVNEECWSGNIAVAKKMEEIIADVMAADSEIKGWNLEWMERFAKYANKWMPRLFPANYYNNMVNVWTPFDFDPGHRYPSVRYPWITTVAYTSEVTDQTAHGDYLHLVARVQVLHDVEVIRMMLNSGCVFHERITETEDGSVQTYYRQRPLLTR